MVYCGSIYLLTTNKICVIVQMTLMMMTLNSMSTYIDFRVTVQLSVHYRRVCHLSKLVTRLDSLTCDSRKNVKVFR